MKSSEFKNYLTQRTKIGLKNDLYSDLKQNHSFDEIQKILNHPSICNHGFTKKFVYSNALTKNEKDLGNGYNLSLSNNIESELNWILINILKYSEQISDFLYLRNQFEIELLLGNYESARNIVNKVDNDICSSMWSIENRLILDEYQFGTEKNWEIRNKYFEPGFSVPLILMTDIISTKIEKDFSILRFKEYSSNWKKNYRNDFNFPEDLLELVYFYINQYEEDNYKYFSHFLIRINNFSIIDKYILFVRVCQHLIREKKDLKDFITISLKKIQTKINDTTIDNIILSANPTHFTQNGINKKYIKIFDEYTLGNYDSSFELSKVLLKEIPNIFEIAEIYVKSAIYKNMSLSSIENIGNDGSLINKSIKAVYNFLQKNKKTNQAILDLKKIIYTLNSFSFSSVLNGFLQKDKNENYYSKNASAINNNNINPIFYKTYKNKEDAIAFMSKFSELIPNSPTINILSTMLSDKNVKFSEKIPEFKKDIYQARIFITNGELLNAIKLYHSLLKDENFPIYIYEEILINLYTCYYNTQQYENCIKLVVDNYFKNKELLINLKTEKLIETISKTKFKCLQNINNLIELPIIFKITQQKSNKINFACNKFLYSLKISKPSQIENKLTQFDFDKIVFFLNNVCSIDTIRFSSKYHSSNDLENERVNICQILSNIDKDNIKTYNEEISIITQKQVIQKAVSKIDEGKIFVNLDKLKNSLEELIKEDFERNLRLFMYSEEFDYKNFDIKSTEEKAKFKTSAITDNFRNMFFTIRDKYISSNEYGLDTYLSTRIRHGSLLNHIRSVFESLYLVTKKDDDKNYSNNEHWNLEYLSKIEYENIQNVFADFSKKIDDLSAVVKEEWIQIKTKIKNQDKDAMFNFDYSKKTFIMADGINELKGEIEQDNKFKKELVYMDTHDYDSFIDSIFQELIENTERNLSLIRNSIRTKLKEQFNQIIISLENELRKIVKVKNIPELFENVTKCGTDVRNTLDRLSDWFKFSQSKFDSDFKIKTILDTAIQIINKMYPHFNINPQKQVAENLIFKGDTFEAFVDIMNILLENIIIHAKIPPEDIDINIAIKKYTNNLQMKFSNNLSESVDILELMNRLGEIETSWNSSDLKGTAIEGRSGFTKIKKILSFDLNRKFHSFNYDISDDNIVEININMELNNL